MEREQKLYDKFVEVLTNRLESEPTAQDLSVVLNFLKYNNIQATTKHKGLKNLAEKANDYLELPFDGEDEVPLKRVK